MSVAVLGGKGVKEPNREVLCWTNFKRREGLQTAFPSQNQRRAGLSKRQTETNSKRRDVYRQTPTFIHFERTSVCRLIINISIDEYRSISKDHQHREVC